MYTQNDITLEKFPPLGDEIYRLLRKRILSGHYQRGERLSEAKLSAELKISRSPIREALIQLEHTGLVNTIPRKGVFVSDFTSADIQELRELRSMLEQFFMRVLIEESRLTPERMAVLRQIVADMEKLWSSEELSESELARQSSNLDFKFHMTLVEFSERPIIVNVYRNMSLRSRAIIGLMNIHPNSKINARDHHILLDALEAGDLERAQKVATDHMRWMVSDKLFLKDAE